MAEHFLSVKLKFHERLQVVFFWGGGGLPESIDAPLPVVGHSVCSKANDSTVLFL